MGNQPIELRKLGGLNIGCVECGCSHGSSRDICRVSVAEVVEWLAARQDVERDWVCYYPEFDDPECRVGGDVGKTRQPRKHRQCGERLMVKVVSDE